MQSAASCEETGYQAATIKVLTSGPPSAGLTPEMVTFFLASNLTRVDGGGGDASENIVVHKVPLADVPKWLESRRRQKCLVDPKVYAGLYFAQQHR